MQIEREIHFWKGSEIRTPGFIVFNILLTPLLKSKLK